MSIRCPHCGTRNHGCKDTRGRFDNSIQRVRECRECKEVFITIETVIPHRIPPTQSTRDFLRDLLLGDVMMKIEGAMVTNKEITAIE